MRLNKKEGIVFLERFGLPTVKRLNPMLLTVDSPELKDGISVRLSPKEDTGRNVFLPSIHNVKNLNQIQQFIEKNKHEYEVILHKTVKPETIGTISKLEFRNSIVIETYRNFEERTKGIINNRVIIPVFADKTYVSKLEIEKKDPKDFKEFCKVISILKDIPFNEYEMEYVIEDGNVIFTELTLPNNREYRSYRSYIIDEER